jgi:hypothetical protein
LYGYSFKIISGFMFISHNFTIHDVGSGCNYLGGKWFGGCEDLCAGMEGLKWENPIRPRRVMSGFFIEKGFSGWIENVCACEGDT